MKNFSIFFICIAFLWACDDELDNPNFIGLKGDEIQIRIINQSNYNIRNIKFSLAGEEYNHNTLNARTKTLYKKYAPALSIFDISFQVKEVEFNYVEKDLKNQKEVKAGKYDFLLYNVDTTAQTFTFRFQKS